jgi:hypothetical protein
LLEAPSDITIGIRVSRLVRPIGSPGVDQPVWPQHPPYRWAGYQIPLQPTVADEVVQEHALFSEWTNASGFRSIFERARQNCASLAQLRIAPMDVTLPDVYGLLLVRRGGGIGRGIFELDLKPQWCAGEKDQVTNMEKKLGDLVLVAQSAELSACLHCPHPVHTFWQGIQAMHRVEPSVLVLQQPHFLQIKIPQE